MSTLPYGMETWVPVLRGGAPPAAVLHDDDGVDALRAAYRALARGERIAVTADDTRGRGAELDALEAALTPPFRIERFVVFPGTGGGFVLLPTASAAVLRAGLPLLPPGQQRWRAAGLGLGALAPLGLARLLGQAELALITRGEAHSFGAALAKDDEHVAIAAGVPDGRQKLVARIIAAKGPARTIAKLAHRPASVEAVQHERRALERVARFAPELAPRLIDHGVHSGRPWLTQELLEGQRSPDVLHEGHAAFLARLAQGTLSRQPLAHHPLLSAARATLAELDVASDPDWHAELGALAACLAADGASLSTAFAHGDFTPWNLAVSPHGMRAFDWECALEDAPLLFDAFHFHVQTGVLVHRRDGAALLDSLRSVLQGPARELVALGAMAPPDVLRALGLYLLHVTVRDEALQRSAPAAFVQVGWLRRARRELVRRVGGLLRERRMPWDLAGRLQEQVA